jgi:hypothetical protein
MRMIKKKSLLRTYLINIRLIVFIIVESIDKHLRGLNYYVFSFQH